MELHITELAPGLTSYHSVGDTVTRTKPNATLRELVQHYVKAFDNGQVEVTYTVPRLKSQSANTFDR